MAEDPVPDLSSCQSNKGRTGVSGSHVQGSIVVEVMVYLRKDMKNSSSLDSIQSREHRGKRQELNGDQTIWVEPFGLGPLL